MRTYHDTLPLNARIRVNYGDGSVSFEYPDKNAGFMRKFLFVLGPVVLYFTAAHVIVLSILLLIGAAAQALEFLSTNQPIIPETLITQSYSEISNYPQFILDVLRFAAGFLIYFIGNPMLIAFVITKNYSHFSTTFPKLMALAVSPLMVRTRISGINSTTFELPLFHNIVLDYELNGDYAEHIKSVEVTEYPFKWLEKPFPWIFQKEVEKTNDSMWKAVFMFREIPKEGDMLLRFF